MQLRGTIRIFPYMVIVLLFGYVIFLSECSKGKEEDVPVADTTIIKHYFEGDSLLQDVYIEAIPEPILIELPPDPSPFLPIDSLDIIVKYMSANHYADTIMSMDSTMRVYLYLVVKENELFQRDIKMQNLRPTTYETKIIQQQDHRKTIYVGGGIGGNEEMFLVSACGGFKTGKGNIVMGEYEFMQGTIMIKYYKGIPIDFTWFKKKKIP